jgi:NADH:ubiquinone oxidoreductase subunit B-like Fe-S oxidoreductase
VLIVSDDAIGSRMAGRHPRLGIRQALCRCCQVTWRFLTRRLDTSDFDLRRYEATLQAMVAQSDVVITSGYVLKRLLLTTLPVPLVLSIPIRLC